MNFRKLMDIYINPSSGLRFTGIATGLWIIGITYCFLHQFSLDQPLDAMLAIRWSFAAIVPFYAAFEAAKLFSQSKFRFIIMIALCVSGSGASLFLFRVLMPVSNNRNVGEIIFHQLPPIGLTIILILGALLLKPKAEFGDKQNRISLNPDLINSLAGFRIARSAGNYVELVGEKNNKLIRATMKAMETDLAKNGFIRIHRSVMVARNEVDRLDRQHDGQWVVLKSGERLRVSKTFQKRLVI